MEEFGEEKSSDYRAHYQRNILEGEEEKREVKIGFVFSFVGIKLFY